MVRVTNTFGAYLGVKMAQNGGQNGGQMRRLSHESESDGYQDVSKKVDRLFLGGAFRYRKLCRCTTSGAYRNIHCRGFMADWKNRIKETRTVHVEDIQPHPSNWRRHPQVQESAIRGLLAQVGIVAPVGA